MRGSVEAITTGSVAGKALLGRRIGISSTWTDVSAVSTVKIVTALASGTLTRINAVAGNASAVTGLTCCSDLYVASCWASSKTITASAVGEEIVHARTRKARETGRAVTGGAVGIATGAAIIPSVLILVGIA